MNRFEAMIADKLQHFEFSRKYTNIEYLLKKEEEINWKVLIAMLLINGRGFDINHGRKETLEGKWSLAKGIAKRKPHVPI